MPTSDLNAYCLCKASPSAAKGEGNIDDKKTNQASITAAPLTKENLAKVPDGTAKVWTDATIGDAVITDKLLPTKISEAQVAPEATKGEGEVRQVVSRYNEKSGLREETPIDEAKAKDNNKTNCFLRDVMDPSDKGRILYGEVDLGPSDLLDLMKEVLPDDSIIQSFTGPRVSLFSPFVALVHNWDNLKGALLDQAKDTAERKQARLNLAKVLDYVQKFQSKKKHEDLESYFKNRDSYINSGIVTYEYIWTIFPPGTEVVASTFLGSKQILIVDTEPYPDEEDKKAYLFCWYHDHNGNDWTPVEMCFKIERFHGTKSIDSLPCCPLRYYKQHDKEFDRENFREELKERGKIFEGLCTKQKGAKQMFDYKAPLLSVEKPFRSQISSNDAVGNHILPQHSKLP